MKPWSIGPSTSRPRSSIVAFAFSSAASSATSKAKCWIQSGIVVSRIAAEFVLIVFRINEHLGAIRNQGANVGIQGPGFGEQ